MNRSLRSALVPGAAASAVVPGFVKRVCCLAILALCLLAPVIVNVLLFGVLMSRQALPSGLVVALLWILVYVPVRSAFSGIYQMHPAA